MLSLALIAYFSMWKRGQSPIPHAGIATEYTKKKGVFYLHYKDRNDNDVLIDLSEVKWVCD